MIIRERQNIIDLIRKDAYNSCIITSYSFDFIFFEERLMPALKSAGIKNINLFLDGNYFDEQLENTIGREFQSQRTYSVNTVYKAGIFHPKILFLIGAKQALMIIGSGNISTSGMSSNDEVWGAFHINSLESPNAPLLAQCWSYLEGLYDHSLGFNKEKIQWIYQTAPWLNELSRMNTQGFVAVNKELEISFLCNNEDGTIYQKLLQIVSADNVDSLTIVSPYFDSKGDLLKQLLEDYHLEHIDCLTDFESGLLPNKLEENYHKNFSFYDWKDCVEGFDQRLNRLHAKLFDFRLSDGTEYLLFGSCNATINALGTLNKKAKNDESAILIKRKTNVSYLDEFGISIKDTNPFTLSTFINNSTKPNEILPSSKHQFKILHAEKNGAQLNVIFNKDINDSLNIVLRDKNLRISEIHPLIRGQNLECKLKIPEKADQVYLSLNDKRISNIRPIQDVFMLTKSNPDPKQAEINQLIDSISQNPDFNSILSIFQYLSYSQVDEDFSLINSEYRNSSLRREKTEKKYDSLTEDELYQLPAVQSQVRDLICHPNIQLADLIGLLGKGIISKKEKISEDIESSLIGEDSENYYGGEKQISEISSNDIIGEDVKDAILNHSDKLYQYHNNSINEQIKIKNFNNRLNSFITLNEVSNFIILMGLLNEFYGKTYEIKAIEIAINYKEKFNNKIRTIEKNYHLEKSGNFDRYNRKTSFYYVMEEWVEELKDELDEIDPDMFIHLEEYKSKVFKHRYFSNSNIRKEDYDGIKIILVKTLGMFLLHLSNSSGFRKYDLDVLNDKMNHIRNTLFEISTTLILRIEWSANEFEYRDILLLDLLHLLYPNQIVTQDIIAKIEYYPKIKTQNGRNLLELYKSQILGPYAKWRAKYDNKSQDIIQNKFNLPYKSIIYSSNFGFASVGQIKPDTLDLRKPALLSYSDESEFFRLNFLNSKILVFE